MSSDDTYPKVMIDESDRDTETGVESTRTVLVEIETWGTDQTGRKAVFNWDDDRDTYVLDEYQGAKNGTGGWRTQKITFKQSDVGTLQAIADHLREATRGPVDVELFVGVDNAE